MTIQIENLSKNFGSFQALKDINLNIGEGKITALLGSSGSGKSTLLRIIAGLEKPDQGAIYIQGKNTTGLEAGERNIGFVFQHYALFKHMTIRQNIAFGLEIRKLRKEVISERVEQLLELIQLQGLGDRYPSQLSGGQRQRVALARALAIQPQVLLLDEPFGALDAKVRKELRTWLRKLHDEVHVTSVFVTHDQEEAMEVADEIVIMSQGKIEQVGTPKEIYDHPKTPFVMSFIGSVNILPSTAQLFKCHDLQGGACDVFIRPHDLELLITPTENTTPATLTRVVYLGKEIQADVTSIDGYSFAVQVSRERFSGLNLEAGQKVFVQAKPKSLSLTNSQCQDWFYEI